VVSIHDTRLADSPAHVRRDNDVEGVHHGDVIETHEARGWRGRRRERLRWGFGRARWWSRERLVRIFSRLRVDERLRLSTSAAIPMMRELLEIDDRLPREDRPRRANDAWLRQFQAHAVVRLGWGASRREADGQDCESECEDGDRRPDNPVH